MNTLAQLEADVRKQLESSYTASEARLTANLTRMMAEILANSPMGALEDHLMVPALAALLGYSMHTAKSIDEAREELKAMGLEILPSLYQGDGKILNIVALMNKERVQAPVMSMGTGSDTVN